MHAPVDRLRRNVPVIAALSLALPVCGTEQAPGESAATPLRPRIDEAFAFAEKRTRATIEELARLDPDHFASLFPVVTKPSPPDLGSWEQKPVEDWRSGFFPGVVWELYRHGRDPRMREAALAWTSTMATLENVPIDHDLGFRFLPTFGEALFVLDESDDPGGVVRRRARGAIERSASSLNQLFDAGSTPVGAYRAFPLSNDYLAPYPVYMDSMMNVELPLLAWDLAGRPASGPSRVLYEHAVTHAKTVMAEHVRPNGSTYHIVQHEEGQSPGAGRIHKKISDQGFAAESTWSRGQAWAIHGFTTVYRFTRDDPSVDPRRFLETAMRAADYFIEHLPNDTTDPYNHVPGDFVPPTDFDAALGEPEGPWNDANGDGVLGDRRPGTHTFTPRDSSAAAVAAAGLLELGTLVDDPDLRERYLGAAENILFALLTFRAPDGTRAYLAVDSPHQGILARGSTSYGLPQQSLSFGDHYFLQALRRCLDLETREGEARRCGRTLDPGP
ncbi:hypothetical protein [Polyangium sp. 6x1]|uniref:hypothetical protein n=1 Tax=Polyangium sp. 6x1 TaxID=3042689 RepID=UPI0024823E8B|nr:hypothetical protein [Polyangium sp. 6x1]MDI1449095.1 hypothetical protein [Polyangium sp. 6x1]